MRMHRPSFVGAAVGVLAGMLVIGSAPSFWRAGPIEGPMIGEHDGLNGASIQKLVMQYVRGSAFVWPTYRQFLQYQPAGVTVYMVCPREADFSEIEQRVGNLKCTIVPIFTGHEMTTWARDRWIAMEPEARGEAITLVEPKGELQQEIWPARAGDSHVAEDIAKALAPAVRARRSGLYFDGGDILADGRFAFVTSAVVRRNVQHTVVDRGQLVARLQHDLKREVVLMEDGPDHHAGMYMMAAGAGRMIVGDPSLGKGLVDIDAPGLAAMDGGPDFSAQTQKRFDAVAKLAAEHGYRVIRIPTVPGRDGKRFLTYVNVIMDAREGKAVVYMPVFADQPRLNAAARGAWEGLGYEVKPVDCTAVWGQGGTLHCLVNVMERG